MLWVIDMEVFVKKIGDVFSDEELEEMLSLIFKMAYPESQWEDDMNCMKAQDFLERHKDKMNIWGEIKNAKSCE